MIPRNSLSNRAILPPAELFFDLEQLAPLFGCSVEVFKAEAARKGITGPISGGALLDGLIRDKRLTPVLPPPEAYLTGPSN
jgi:hypothetical protein